MPIRVKVKLFAERDKGFRWIHLSDDARRLRTLLDVLSKERNTNFIQQGCITIVNKEPVTEDMDLSDGDEIEILPMVQGG